MFVRFWNHFSCHDVLEKMTSECNLEIPTDRKFSGSAVNVLHALPNIFGCRRRRVNTWQKSFLLTLNQDCSSYHDLSKKHCRRVVGGEGGLISLYIYIEKFKNLLVRNQWTNFNIAWQECCFGDLLPRLFKQS